VTCGMDILLERRLNLLKGRRVGLLSHQAALVRGGATSAQAMHRAIGGGLRALFGPEHGFSGIAAAGEKTYSSRHPDWNIPIHSLYGDMRSPSLEMLSDLDVVVCDLQDIGVRCYTYLATLFNMYKACRSAGIEMIVTDRSVPLPCVVDGPMLKEELTSFVAPCKLPMVYGMTPAETVRWISQAEQSSFQPVVIPMSGWKREHSLCYDIKAGGFMPPSPGIKSVESACSYSALVFSEALPGLDCGRDTNLAFRVFGAPWMEGERFCALLNRLKLEGVFFHPHRYMAAAGNWKGRELDGIRIAVSDPRRFQPVECSLHIIREVGRCYGDSRLWRCKGVRQIWFDKLYGDSNTRSDLKTGRSLTRIFKRWEKDNAGFLTDRRKILMYQ